MKLANYRSDTLRFSVSFLLISFVILSNLFFYHSAQNLKEGNEHAYFSQQNASVSGVIFDNSLEVPVCCVGFEKVIEKGLENPNAINSEINHQSNHCSAVENRFISFEIGKNSEGLHIAHYLKNCAIKIPFTSV